MGAHEERKSQRVPDSELVIGKAESSQVDLALRIWQTSAVNSEVLTRNACRLLFPGKLVPVLRLTNI